METVFVSLWTKCNNNSKVLEWITNGANPSTAATRDKNNKEYLQTRILRVNEYVKLLSGALFMSFYKEHILPAINNCRASPNFVKHIEGNNINYTQNNNKTQAQIVTAFSFSVHKSIVLNLLDNDDKSAAIFWKAKSTNQKLHKFGLIRNNFQSDSDINLNNIIPEYERTSE